MVAQICQQGVTPTTVKYGLQMTGGNTRVCIFHEHTFFFVQGKN
jgi:hypothetical protein